MSKAAWIGILVVVMAVLAPASALRAAPASVLIAEVQAALDKGDASQATTLAETGLKEAGPAERGRLLLYRGLAQELLGATDAAVLDFTQALASNALPPEERAQALLQRGFLRDGLGKLEQATADYSPVIVMKGDSLATALNNRANIYRRQNRPMEAGAIIWRRCLPVGASRNTAITAWARSPKPCMTLSPPHLLLQGPGGRSDYSLASERLAALGGAPEGMLADADKVTLRSPAPAASPADAARGFKVATEASKEPDGTIVLRPPRNRQSPNNPSPDNVALRPPGTQARPIAERTVRAAPLPSRKPALRPALDQRERAPVQEAVPAGGLEVQLGAWRSQAEAEVGWGKAKAKAPGPLGGLSPHIVTVELPGRGLYYRCGSVPPARARRSCVTVWWRPACLYPHKS